MTTVLASHSTGSRVTSPDVIVLASTIHTMTSTPSAPTAIAITDGVVSALGSRADARGWAGEHTQILDLGDATVVPGFVDAHIHPVLSLDMTRGVNLTGIDSLEGVIAALVAEEARLTYADADPQRADGDTDALPAPGDTDAQPTPAQWLLAWGLNPNVFDGDAVSNEFLDELPTDRPTLIAVFDGHSAVASKSALALAGIDGPREFGDSASIVVDDAGKPTGLLLELNAQAIVQAHIPPLTFEQRVHNLRTLLEDMAASGLTGGQVPDFTPYTIDLLEAIEAQGDLPIRLRLMPWFVPGSDGPDLQQLISMQGRRGRRWHVEGVKLMIDGTVDNGTAWLYEPDTLGESTRSLWLDPHEYAQAVAALHESGVPTVTHAIGDNAVGFVAGVLAQQPADGPMHRIEHIETVTDEVIDLIARSRITTSMQPTHCTHFVNADHSDNWSTRLGTTRANRAWRIRDLRDAGVVVALGSDWPVAPFDPRPIFADAQLRRPANHPHIDAVLPEQGLTARQALEGYTTQIADSTESDGGRIRVGAPADLSAFSLDPLTAAPDAFAEAHVRLTMIDGVVVHDGSGIHHPASSGFSHNEEVTTR
jgi:predicted amidohydrolase YtcJ